MRLNPTIVATHSIAGIVFRTETAAWLPRLLDEPFDRFRVADTEPDVRHRIHKVAVDSLTLSPPSDELSARLFRCTRGWPDRLENPLLRSPAVRDNLEKCLERPERFRILLHENLVFIRDFARREIDLFYVPEYVPGPARYPAESRVAGYLPALFSTSLPDFSAVVIHAASVIRKNKAAVFVAASGGGKTTVAGLSAGNSVLSDDQTVLRRQDRHISAYANPLAMCTSGPGEARIGGLFWLAKGDRFKLEPLRPADMVHCLAAGNLFTTGLTTPGVKKQWFNVIHDACHQALAYRMRFPKDYVDWDAIDAAMAR
jgi:hypothetical protein